MECRARLNFDFVPLAVLSLLLYVTFLNGCSWQDGISDHVYAYHMIVPCCPALVEFERLGSNRGCAQRQLLLLFIHKLQGSTFPVAPHIQRQHHIQMLVIAFIRARLPSLHTYTSGAWDLRSNSQAGSKGLVGSVQKKNSLKPMPQVKAIHI